MNTSCSLYQDSIPWATLLQSLRAGQNLWNLHFRSLSTWIAGQKSFLTCGDVKKRTGEQLNYFWNMYPKPFSWARNERKLFSDGKSRGTLLERVALKSLIFSICRPAMFLVLKFIDRCKKNHIVAGFVVLYKLPNFLSKKNLCPFLREEALN